MMLGKAASCAVYVMMRDWEKPVATPVSRGSPLVFTAACTGTICKMSEMKVKNRGLELSQVSES